MIGVFLNLVPVTLVQSLVYSLVAIAIMIPFRTLSLPDLTVEGSFPLGGCVAEALVTAGLNPWAGTFLAVAAGDIVGATADRKRHLGHQSPRARTSSSAATASIIRAFSAPWRLRSKSAERAPVAAAASTREIAASIRAIGLGGSGSAIAAGLARIASAARRFRRG